MMEPLSNTNDALEKRETRRHPIILVRSLTSHACTISFFVFISTPLAYWSRPTKASFYFNLISFVGDETEKRRGRWRAELHRIIKRGGTRRHGTLRTSARYGSFIKKKAWMIPPRLARYSLFLTPFLWSFQFFIGSAPSHDYSFFIFGMLTVVSHLIVISWQGLQFAHARRCSSSRNR